MEHEPAQKRPRTEEIEPIHMGADIEEEAGIDPWVREPARYVCGRDCLRLRFCKLSSGQESSRDGTSPREAEKDITVDDNFGCEVVPRYVHQLFDGEALELPMSSRPLKVEVIYATPSLHVYLQLSGASGALEDVVQGVEKKEGAATVSETSKDVMYKLLFHHPHCSKSLSEMHVAAGTFSTAVCGDVTSSYQDEMDGNARKFEVRWGELPGSLERAAFCARLQPLFRWFIETHEDVTPEDDGRWSLLTIFEHPESGTPSRLVAVATVYAFHRFVAGKGVNLLLRVCQALVLPGLQGQGHGARLLQAVYDHAAACDAVEVTVEDPNFKFRALRDVVDLRNCIRLGLLSPSTAPGAPPSLEARANARAALRITEEQISRCHEMRAWLALQVGPISEATMTTFRLGIKRRLNKKYQEELDEILAVGAATAAAASGVATDGGQDMANAAAAQTPSQRNELATARKARLEELYQELMAEYRLVVQHIQPQV